MEMTIEQIEARLREMGWVAVRDAALQIYYGNRTFAHYEMSAELRAAIDQANKDGWPLHPLSRRGEG